VPWSTSASGTVGPNSITVYDAESYNFKLGKYYGDTLTGGNGNDVLYARANTATNPSHGALLMGGAGFDTFDGTTDSKDLQTTNIVVAVDYSLHYTSKKVVKWYYTGNPTGKGWITQEQMATLGTYRWYYKTVYSGVTYETLAPQTYYVKSFHNNPLTWYYNKSA
jgi:Ca2+-binding RTX toxin-like protein